MSVGSGTSICAARAWFELDRALSIHLGAAGARGRRYSKRGRAAASKWSLAVCLLDKVD